MSEHAPAPFDLLVLSPHSDDAAFSIGGVLAGAARAGQRLALQTVFASDEWRGFGQAAVRQTEDESFARSLGLALLPPLLDEAPRREARYRSGRRLFDWIASDDPLIDKLLDLLTRQLIAQPAARILAPLGVGEHVDHQLLHAAARRLPANVEYYADLPYALMPGHLTARLRNLGEEHRAPSLVPAVRAWSQTPLLGKLRPLVRPFAAYTFCHSLRRRPGQRARQATVWESHLSPSSVEDHLAAIACYPSQWPLFFASLEEWRARLQPIRLYTPKPATMSR